MPQKGKKSKGSGLYGRTELGRLALSKARILGLKNGTVKVWNKGKKGLQVAWNKGTIGYLGGENHYNWKGGISKIDKLVRQMALYKQWRSDCFARDNWTCQTCHFKGYVTVHHIKAFHKILKEFDIKNQKDASECLELWDLNNGVTLCEDCHKLTDNYAGRIKNI